MDVGLDLAFGMKKQFKYCFIHSAEVLCTSLDPTCFSLKENIMFGTS